MSPAYLVSNTKRDGGDTRLDPVGMGGSPHKRQTLAFDPVGLWDEVEILPRGYRTSL